MAYDAALKHYSLERRTLMQAMLTGAEAVAMRTMLRGGTWSERSESLGKTSQRKRKREISQQGFMRDDLD